MIRKNILNGLILSFALSAIPMQANADWITTLTHYFNKPTQKALIITTAAAGVSLGIAGYLFWKLWKKTDALKKKNDESSALESTNAGLVANNNDLRTHNAALQTSLTQQQKITQTAQEILSKIDLKQAAEQRVIAPRPVPSAPRSDA